MTLSSATQRFPMTLLATASRVIAGTQLSQSAFLRRIGSNTEQLRQESTIGLQERCGLLRERCGVRHFEQLSSLRRKRVAAHLGLSGMAEAFAIVFEAIRRTTEKSYYDVQLLAGHALAAGSIVEMQTGEGKTLTTALPAFVFALCGRGVHIATTNQYLAERDCEELRPAFEMLGMTVGLLPAQHDPQTKMDAYRSDVTFGTGYDFGFDFLRDQIALRKNENRPLGEGLQRRLGGQHQSVTLLQRGHAFAIVDEADSVLIDEATMPLVLSMSASKPPSHLLLRLAAETADELRQDEDYTVSPAERTLDFTPSGVESIFDKLAVHGTLQMRRPWKVYVDQALRAIHFLHRDVDYVVNDQAVQIVDQHTGRIHPERTWRDGLHQAVEFREGVEVTSEKEIEGRVSRQRFFQFYDHVCGMTGTTTGVESEISRFYQLPVVKIPTHQRCIRQIEPTSIYGSSDDRDDAVVRHALRRRAKGQPVLIGTRTILHSQQLSRRLESAGVEHAVLNGVQDEQESKLVARSGKTGMVTVATNMAGRGTDIKPDCTAIGAGGLCVLGAEHNVTRRVDRQLAGRAARQGQPGTVKFFAAVTDELFQHDERLRRRIEGAINVSDACTEAFTKDIAKVQAKVQREHYERRQAMVQRDHWMERVLESVEKTEAT